MAPPVTSLSPPAPLRRPTAVALGSFDGLHAGHQQVIAKALAMAAETPAPSGGPVPTMVSFWPHPREVLYGETRLRLDLPEEKLCLLAPLGIEQLVVLPFTPALAALTPETFVAEVLARQLEVRCLAVGENFRFGAQRRGDAELLKALGRAQGIRVEVVPTLHDAAGRVSSSRIRQALAEGKLLEAENLLGRPYRFEGLVKKGRGLGRQLGWPTANLDVNPRKLLPKEGVYSAWVWLPQPACCDPWPAVMNLGGQPTVDPDAPSQVEVHLLEVEGRPVPNLVGHPLIVQPTHWLRDQRRFANLQELALQIGRDAAMARDRSRQEPVRQQTPQ